MEIDSFNAPLTPQFWGETSNNYPHNWGVRGAIA